MPGDSPVANEAVGSAAEWGEPESKLALAGPGVPEVAGPGVVGAGADACKLCAAGGLQDARTLVPPDARKDWGKVTP